MKNKLDASTLQGLSEITVDDIFVNAPSPEVLAKKIYDAPLDHASGAVVKYEIKQTHNPIFQDIKKDMLTINETSERLCTKYDSMYNTILNPEKNLTQAMGYLTANERKSIQAETIRTRDEKFRLAFFYKPEWSVAVLGWLYFVEMLLMLPSFSNMESKVYAYALCASMVLLLIILPTMIIHLARHEQKNSKLINLLSGSYAATICIYTLSRISQISQLIDEGYGTGFSTIVTSLLTVCIPLLCVLITFMTERYKYSSKFEEIEKFVADKRNTLIKSYASKYPTPEQYKKGIEDHKSSVFDFALDTLNNHMDLTYYEVKKLLGSKLSADQYEQLMQDEITNKFTDSDFGMKEE